MKPQVAYQSVPSGVAGHAMRRDYPANCNQAIFEKITRRLTFLTRLFKEKVGKKEEKRSHFSFFF